MTEESFKRKLTAILSADVEGYSRLMGEDEDATIRTLTAYRELMSTLIQKHRGRVVDSPGDNLLAEFLSVVDAVRCAVEVQEELRVRNAELPENRRMEFRIGINLGDVVQEEERIYGDGINIAARVEGIAEGGGICISGTVYDSIKNKLSLSYESLGEHTVKNIKEPVRVYRMRIGPDAAAPVVKLEKAGPRPWKKAALAAVAVLVIVAGAWTIWNSYFTPVPQPEKAPVVWAPKLALPDKPSIAVLPFSNISGDPEQEYFSDGITEEIITGLSKVPRLFVIARNSTFTYKGKPVMVQQVGEELGVRYVLEGSVRKAKDRVRITAQLIDAMTGNHLWGEKYDRDLKEIFKLQDEIMMKVIAALQVKLTEGEQAIIVAGGTDNFEAYAKFLQGVEYVKRFNKDGNLLGRKMSQEAITLDPNYPRGYRLLATTHWLDVTLGISKSPRQSLAKAAELYKKVITLDPTDAVAHGFLGHVYTLMRQHEKGIAEVEKAVTLNPNAADAQAFFGYILHFNGRHKEAIRLITKAIRLNPFPPNWYFQQLGFAYCHAGMYEEAIAACKKALRDKPDNLFARRCLATAYSLSGCEQEARAEAAEILRINPKFSLQHFAKTIPYKNLHDRELLIDALRKAGLPEHPPLPLPDKPSIAVLPFTNMSEDPKQAYFSDGISEEIITALSKTPKLFVIARTSSFKYKGKEVDVRTVGRELGVRYVLEGSVRKAEDKVRITAQLIDSQSGNHLWAERYDRDLKDIFAIQDEITLKILTSLQVKLTEGEQARLYARGTKNLEAYCKLLQARMHFYRYNKRANAMARQILEEVIALDPEWATGYGFLASTHVMDYMWRWSNNPRESLACAFRCTKKAIALDDSRATVHAQLGWLMTINRQHEKGVAKGKLAVSLNPNSADAHACLGLCLHYAGRHEEAVAAYKQAIRLNPVPPLWYYPFLGIAYRHLGMLEEALEQFRKVVSLCPEHLVGHTGLTSIYSLMGKEEEARAEAAEVLRIDPKFTLQYMAKVIPYKNKADLELLIDAWRKAGLK